jgi:hypothetical protein
MKRRTLLLIPVLALGCGKDPAKADARSTGRAEGRYDLGTPGEGWTSQRPGGADKAWFHPTHGAAIYTDSNCGSRYEDSPLSDLVNHLTYGIARGGPVSEDTLKLDERDALIRVYDGALDGVPVKVGALVTKKHRCTYDMLYIAPPATFDTGWPSFVTVAQGFRVPSR